MKAPANTEMMTSAALEGSASVAGQFPMRTDTVLAETLALLLSGRKLTSLDAVLGSSTTRLATAIEPLRHKYGWPIVSDDKATGCRDGRVSTVAEYRLLPSTIVAANRAGAVAWCVQVRAARLARRADAAKAKIKADAINAARKSRHQPGQGDLFGGACT